MFRLEQEKILERKMLMLFMAAYVFLSVVSSCHSAVGLHVLRCDEELFFFYFLFLFDIIFIILVLLWVKLSNVVMNIGDLEACLHQICVQIQ